MSKMEDLNDVYVEEFDALNIELRASISEKYPAKPHARKVAKNLRVKSGLIYLIGQVSKTFEDSDMGPQFRQRRYFYYLSGVDLPDCVVTYDIAKDHLHLYVPPHDPRYIIWNGSVLSPGDFQENYDIDHSSYTTELDTDILSFIKQSRGDPIYILHPDQHPKVIPPPTALSWYPEERTMKKLLNHTNLAPAMDMAREIKDSYEIDLIRKANEISTKAHVAVLKSLKKLKYEYEIEGVFTQASLAEGAKHQSYPVIAGSGSNVAYLHYMTNGEPLEGRQMVCLDAGAEWNCYASDVTRTFPINGTYTKEAKAIYDIVDDMQSACIQYVALGFEWQELVRMSKQIGTVGLAQLGLLRNGTIDEYIESGVIAAFFPHGLGHHVGLEVHDVASPSNAWASSEPHDHTFPHHRNVKPAMNGRNSASDDNTYAAAGSPRVLAPGMIITIEPGIYFNRFGMEQIYLKNPLWKKFINEELLETYYPVGGVRIEDDILVTEDGYENLTTTPKGEHAAAIIRGEAME